MSKNVLRAQVALVLVLVMVLAFVPSEIVAAGHADVTLLSVMRQRTEPITYYNAAASQISTLDPQRADNSVSITAIENLFLGLTDANPLNPGQIVPELATAWSFSDNGLVWTFTIRDDVPWVRWDPVAKEAEVLRMVNAHDIAFGMQRACDPRLTAYYTSLANKIIAGCDDLSLKPVEEIVEEDYELVQVFALDDTTLEVHLQFSAGYFFSQTPLWMYRPVYREAIEEHGDDWTEIGNLVTNGPFVLDEWIRGVRRVYLANPHLPEDMRGPGNVERVVITTVQDQGTRFALYRDHQIDRVTIPAAELESVLNDDAYVDQVSRISNLGVYYFGFAYDKPPFDNVHLRRAFSAAVDRTAFVQEVEQGQGIPMIHLTPPGMFGAPPINEVGVGYDPDFARAEMANAGFANCEGLSTIEVVTYAAAADWAEFLSAALERELGCPADLMEITSQEFSVLLETVDPRNDPEDRPHMWSLAWSPVYPDANNWIADVLSCESENEFNRPCSEVDDLILEAAREPDQERRIELYYRAEEMFFGSDGEYPIIPLYLDLSYVLNKSWLEGPFETDGLFGGVHYDWRSVNQEAQLAERDR